MMLARLLILSWVTVAPLTAQELVPQSCADADSRLGTPPKDGLKKLKGKYADVEGVTTYDLLSNMSSQVFKEGKMELHIVGIHEGQTFASPRLQATLAFSVTAGSDNIFKDQNLDSKSQAQGMKDLPVLVDDSIRFRLVATKGNSKTSTNIWDGRKRVEKFTFDLSEEQLLKLVKANTVKIRAGDRMLKLDNGDFDRVRSFYRHAICNGGLKPADS